MALSKIIENSIADEAISSSKLKDFSAAVDLNGVELVLDADADTSITADTDDRIDFKIAGVEHFSFSNSSGDTIIKPMVDAKDIKFQQYDGRTLLDINDGGFVGIENGATGPGVIRIFEDTDNGSNYVGLSVGNVSTAYTLVFPNADGSSGQALTTNGSGVLSFTTLSANTPSSADGQALGSASLEWSDLFLADSGTIQFGNDQDTILTHTDGAGLTLNSTNKLMFNDASQFIQGASATVLDIAATDEIELTATLIEVVGNATVSGTLGVTGVTTSNAGVVVDNITIDGTEIDLSSGDLTIDVAGDIILDADGGDVILKDGGTAFGQFIQSSNNLEIHSSVSDGDMLLRGNDGGATITALTLDMSAAGAATFNDKITAVGTSVFTNLDISGDVDIDGTTNLDVVDIDGAVDMASTLQVDGAITSSAGMTITTADNTDTLTLISTDADANAGPNLRMYRNTSSPADDDVTGQIDFEGRNDNSQDVVYSQLITRTSDVSDGSEDGAFVINVMDDGTLRERMGMDIVATVFNDASQDIDFRVESNGNTHALFVDAGNEQIGLLPAGATVGADVQIGFHDTATTATAMGTAHANDATLLLGGANSGATQGSIYLGGQNGADGNVMGAVYGFSGGSQNSGIEFLEGSGDAYGQIKMSIAQGTGGTLVEAMKINEIGAITKPLQPAFQLNRQGQGTQTISGNSEATIALATERFDQNGDCASNTFTAPVTGKYQLQASFYLRNIDTDMNYVQGKITTSNKTYYFVQSTGGFDATVQYMTKNIIVLADMDASDTASIAVYMPSGSDLLVADETQFSGHLVC